MTDFKPLLNYVTAVKAHQELQAALRDVDRKFDRGSRERENLGKMQQLIADIARADEAVREAYDAALHALDSGLASTTEAGYVRMGQAWLESRRAEIQRLNGKKEQ